MRKAITPFLILTLMTASVQAGDIAGYIGGGIGFTGRNVLGGIGGSSAPPPPGCASPTAPNGVVDLSQCSNAFYIAVIL